MLYKAYVSRNKKETADNWEKLLQHRKAVFLNYKVPFT